MPRAFSIRALLPLLLLVAACDSEPAPMPAPPTPPPAPVHEEHPAPPAAAPMEAAPEGATVSFASPADGATVSSPLKVSFAVEGIEVKPAGELAAGSGHHHLVIDGEAIPMGTVVPKDATHIHYGGGQTETEVELSPGPHTLTMQLADGMHRSYGPALSATIHVTVEGAAAPK